MILECSLSLVSVRHLESLSRNFYLALLGAACCKAPRKVPQDNTIVNSAYSGIELNYIESSLLPAFLAPTTLPSPPPPPASAPDQEQRNQAMKQTAWLKLGSRPWPEMTRNRNQTE